MVIAKSSTFDVSSPVSNILGILTFLMSPSAKTKTEDQSVKAITEGFYQMVNGLSVAIKGAVPEELRRSIARVIERGEILINLELQLRPHQGKVIHVKFDAEKLHQEANENRKIDASGWDEDE